MLNNSEMCFFSSSNWHKVLIFRCEEILARPPEAKLCPTFGSFGTEGHKLIRAIGKKIVEVTGEKLSTSYLFQRISIAIQRGNSSCILGTVPHSEGLEEVFEFVSNPD